MIDARGDQEDDRPVGVLVDDDLTLAHGERPDHRRDGVPVGQRPTGIPLEELTQLLARFAW